MTKPGPKEILTSAAVAAVALLWLGLDWSLGGLGWPTAGAVAAVLGAGALMTSAAFAKKATGLRWPVAVGDRAPSFELPLPNDGGVFRVEDARGQHLLLCFVAGDWCPLCHVVTHTYMEKMDVLTDSRVKLIIIMSSIEPFTLEEGSEAPLLVDEGGRVGAQYVAIIPPDRASRAVQRPESFLIDPDGVLIYGSRFQKTKTHGEPQAVIDLIERAHRTLSAE